MKESDSIMFQEALMPMMGKTNHSAGELVEDGRVRTGRRGRQESNRAGVSPLTIRKAHEVDHLKPREARVPGE